jgi:hypothetical protein
MPRGDMPIIIAPTLSLLRIQQGFMRLPLVQIWGFNLHHKTPRGRSGFSFNDRHNSISEF